jgi:hypothetical protein
VGVVEKKKVMVVAIAFFLGGVAKKKAMAAIVASF